MLVDFQTKHITDAWRIDQGDLPFGFEFLSRATFREINFGEKDEGGERITIAGVELPRKGFNLCKYCGKVQDRNGAIKHALTCPAPDKTDVDSLLACLYLYREFSSEAIRFLLPVTTFSGSEAKLHSFVAALQLGLKAKFRGSIDHLQTTVYDEPIPESSYRKRYLVLFDTEPGGTGYLKQLMQSPEPLMEVFELALQTLRACQCNNSDPVKDGCYRCLYAYRNSYDMPDTSRNTAAELLERVLEHRDKLQRVAGLSQIKVNALFDSELEARFIESLRRLKTGSEPPKLVKKVLAGSGKPGYLLTIGERRWEIEPQVGLGKAQGVEIPSRADFLFYPVGARGRGLPIAVFVDGYLYHRYRIGEDLAQRMAIARTGKFRVWSLTWKDVENRFRGQGDYYLQLLAPADAPLAGNLTALMKRYGVDGLKSLHKTDSYDWFQRLLIDPEDEPWRKTAFVHALLHADRSLSGSEIAATWREEVVEQLPSWFAEGVEDAAGPLLFGRWQGGGTTAPVPIWLAVEQTAVNDGDFSGVHFACRLQDESEQQEVPGFEATWNGFLRGFNLMQFLPHSCFATTTGMKAHRFDALRTAVGPQPATPTEPPYHAKWLEEARELADSTLHDALLALAKAGWPAPVVGFELAGGDGAVTAEAELAWEVLRIAAVWTSEDANAFSSAGWRTFSVEEVASDTSRLLDISIDESQSDVSPPQAMAFT
jgi:DEAD/DEAH box helicase domain-containing protein